MTYEKAFEYADYAKDRICYQTPCWPPEECSECTLNKWIDIVKDAIYKQIPKKPIIYEDYEFIRWGCPCCGAVTLSEHTLNHKYRAFCAQCGQRILWEEK